MNCNPGDLAVILAPRSSHCGLTGNLCRVVSLFPPGDVRIDGHLIMRTDPAPLWLVELMVPALFPGTYENGRIGFLVTRSAAMWDSRLKPWRDPGDDAKDETLSWLPVPTREKEHA